MEILTASGEQNKATPLDLEVYEKLILGELQEDASTNARCRHHEVTEPISWLQFLIDGFFLLTTAGYLVAPYHLANNFKIPRHVSGPEPNNSEIQIAENLVRYFHRRTSNLYNDLKVCHTKK